MTLQSLNNAIGWPGLAIQGSAAPGISTGSTLSGAGNYDALICVAREDMVVSHVAFKCFNATGSPTADIRIETVDTTTGLPTGTLWAVNTNVVTATLTSALTAFALGASATIPKSSVFAVKIAYNSGASLVPSTTLGVHAQRGLPYMVLSGTKAAVTGRTLALGSSSTTFYSVEACYPASSISANAFNNTSSAAKAIRFQMPFKCRAVGLRHYQGAAVGDYAAALLDDSGAELSSSSTAFKGVQASNLATSLVDVFFDSQVTLSPATWYKAALTPLTATNINFYTATLPSSNWLSAWPGGSNFFLSSLSGSWTDDQAQVPLMDILIDQLDDGASVGSGVVSSRIKLGM